MLHLWTSCMMQKGSIGIGTAAGICWENIKQTAWLSIGAYWCTLISTGRLQDRTFSSSISPSSCTQSFRKKFFTALWFWASRSQRCRMLFCSSIRTPSKREESCNWSWTLWGVGMMGFEGSTCLPYHCRKRKHNSKPNSNYGAALHFLCRIASLMKATRPPATPVPQHLRTPQVPRWVVWHDELTKFKV